MALMMAVARNKVSITSVHLYYGKIVQMGYCSNWSEAAYMLCPGNMAVGQGTKEKKDTQTHIQKG